MTAYMDHKDLANETISDDRAREITDGVHRVLDLIARTEFTSGREEGSVTLLAATKTRDVGEIMAAIDAGVHMIGENRPQEVIATIESVDSFELAEKIARRAAAREQTVGVLLEVNESGEPTKSGCAPDEAFELALRIAQLEGLELQGLMTVGAHVDDEREIRRGFAHLRDVRDRVRDSDAEGTATCVELSMGMSGDMTYAIDEGATIVRIGQAIFGERDFK